MTICSPPGARTSGSTATGPSRPRPEALLDQPAPHRLRHRGRAIRHAELLVQRLEVGLDRRRAHMELRGDRGRALARRETAEHVVLARGEVDLAGGRVAADRLPQAGLDLAGED